MRRWIPQFLAASVFLVLAATGRADEDAKTLLAKAIKAHGGEDNIAKYKAGRAKAKGKIEVAGGLDFTQDVVFLLPDKFKDIQELEVMGNTVRVVTIINGDKTSIKANGTDVELTDALKDELKNALHLSRATQLLPLKGKEFELSLLGEVKVNDKPALGMKVKCKDKRDIDLYFDKETGLLAKTERRGVDPMSGQEFTEERYIKEYQKVDGLPTAKKVVVHRDGKLYLEAEIVEVKHLETVDETEFAKP